MAKNPTTDQLLIAYQQGEKKGREGERLKIAQDTRETSPNARRQFIPERYGVGGYEDNPFDDFGDYRGPAIQNPQTGLFEWAMNQLQINPEIAGALLPGERGSSNTGGLKGMRPSDVERYLNENGITGPAAEKIWNKYRGLQGDINLPLANVWGHETPSDTFNRKNYPGRDASDELRIEHMRKYHQMKKQELA
jgi:hypothetical protein